MSSGVAPIFHTEIVETPETRNWAANIVVHYTLDGAGSTEAEQEADAPDLEIDLLPSVRDSVVPGSVRFEVAGEHYIDRGTGLMSRAVDPQTDAGTTAGSIDYASGRARLSNYVAGAPAITVRALRSEVVPQLVWGCAFRIPGAPVRAGSVYVSAVSAETGETISATVQLNGEFAAAKLRGTLDTDTGVVKVQFGQMVAKAGNEGQPWYLPELVVGDNVFKPHLVVAGTVRYNAVIVTYLPLSADLLGLDPVRLPLDGRVPIFRPGEVAVVHNTQTIVKAAPLNNGDEIVCGRERLARVEVVNANGTFVPTAKYTADLDAGVVTLTDVTDMIAPLSVHHRVEDMVLITDVQIDGTIAFARPLSHDFPAGTTAVSSALPIGDMQGRIGVHWAQQTWTGVWSNSVIGSEPAADYNASLYPITTSNAGAIQERWALIFVNTTEVRIVGEYSGQIAQLPIAAEIAPLNPVTGQPYFVINPLGWGAGWATGNVVRFNTFAANFPAWFARTVLQGPATVGQDRFRVQVRGNAS